jgi:hypothetical protein
MKWFRFKEAKTMSYDIGPQIGIEGEKQYKNAVAGINQDLKVFASELGKVTAQFDGNADSMEALTAKQKVYNAQVDEQKKKVETLKDALANSVQKYGEADKRTKDWQISLNKAEAELAKTESALKDTTNQIDNFGNEAADGGNAIEKAGKKAKESGDDAEKGKSGWDKLGDGLTKVGKLAGKAVAALGAGAVAAAGGVAAMTTKAAQSADEINTLAKQTGLSTEEIQKFQFASEQIDVSFDTLAGSKAKLIKNMATASKGTGDAAEAFKKLGISVTDSNGALRNNQDVFNEAINALGKIENGTQRDAYAMQIFGKSAQDLNPLILGGADALKEYGDQAEASGLILSQDALDNLNSYADAMDTFKATLSGSGNLFATVFAGPMADGLDTITGYLTDMTSAFNSGGIGAMSDKIGTILADAISKITENMPKIIELGLNIVKKLVEGISQNIPALMEGATTIIMQLVNALLEMLPELLKMGLEIIKELALGIANALPELIPTIVETVLTIVDALIDNIDMLIDASIAIIVALANGLINALPRLIEKAPIIIGKLIAAIVANLPKILAAGAQVVGSLVSGVSGAIPKVFAIGGNLITGLWNGMNNKLQWLKDKISSFTSSVISSIKEFFGVHSPSTVFADIGGNLSAGLAEGITDKAGLVTSAMNRLNGQLTASAILGASDASAGGYGVAVSNIYMDGVLVATASGKAQYRKNKSRARSFGVVTV